MCRWVVDQWKRTCDICVFHRVWSLRVPSRVVSTWSVKRSRKLPFQDDEISDRDQRGVSGNCLSGHERLREDRIRHVIFRGGRQDPRVSEESTSHRHTHSHDGETIRDKSRFSGTPRSEKLRSLPPDLTRFRQHFLVTDNPLVADVENDETLVTYFNEKYRLRYICSTDDILLGVMCYYFLEFGKHGGHFSSRSHRVLQGWKHRTPSRSRDPHVWCIWDAYGQSWSCKFLRQGHWEYGRLPVKNGDVLLQSRGFVDHSERWHPDS